MAYSAWFIDHWLSNEIYLIIYELIFIVKQFNKLRTRWHAN